MSDKFKLIYYPQLDGLRGIAILIVLFFHAKFPFFSGGYIGVDIFFVLSGFLITSLLIQEFIKNGTIDFKKFYIRRFKRLFPALFFFILIYSILSYFILNKSLNLIFLESTIALTYTSNLFQAFQIHDLTLINHTWSLSIEEQFYLLWPILLFILLKFRFKINNIFVSIILISIFVFLWRNYLIIVESPPFIRLYTGFDTRLDSLMLGCAMSIFINYFKKDILNNIILNCILITCISYFIYIISQMSWLDIRMFTLHFYLVSISSSLFIYCILISKNKIVSTIIKNKYLVEIGKISYGLYLWHYPIFRILRQEHSPIFVLLVGGIISVLIALISYHFVEKKFHYKNTTIKTIQHNQS